MEQLKYVKLRRFNEIVIFPDVLEHSKFRHLKPVSAGFCFIHPEKDEVKCFGESTSLKLISQPEDSHFATAQIFGFDAAMKLDEIQEP